MLRADIAPNIPKLRATLGAFVTISPADDDPPMLPVIVVSVKLPVDVLVLIVYDEDEVILPVPVDKVTACIVVLPRLPVMAMPSALVWLTPTVRFVTALPMLS